MSFTEAVQDGFDHYTKFDGRASRPAFWWWFLFSILVSIAGSLIDAILGTSFVYILAALALFLPGLSVAIRRLHDTGRSGWWILIGIIPIIGAIVLIIFYIEKGDEGANEYGPPPPDAAPSAAPAA